VFKSKRASLFDVTLETHLILCRCRPQLLGEETAMLIVTVCALNQALFHTMPERPVEVLFDIGVAAVTQLGLLVHQQELLLFSMMWRVAGDAAYIINIVLRAVEVGMFLSIFMTTEAALADLFRGFVFEGEDLAFVSASLNVFLAWAVTRLTALPFRTFLGEGCFPVWSRLEILKDVFMAGFAGVRSNVQRRIGGPLIALLSLGIVFSLFAIRVTGGGGGKRQSRNKDNSPQAQSAGHRSPVPMSVDLSARQSASRFQTDYPHYSYPPSKIV